MKTSKTIVVALVLAVCPALPMTAIMASLITTTPDLPPNGDYVTEADFFAQYTGGGLDAVLQNVIFRPLTSTTVRADIGGDDEKEDFDAKLMGNLTIDTGGGPVGPSPFSLTGPVQTIVTDRLLSTQGLFAAEIVSMSLSGDVGGMPVLIRESPTLASVGQTDIADLGGGLYHIDSFFDVFTELSVDGGESWIAAGESVRITLIPEPTSCVLVLLGLGTMAFRKRWR